MSNGYRYLSDLIVSGGAVAFTTPDGRKWRMRQPTPEQLNDSLSAYELQRNAVLNDKRLQSLAKNPDALAIEAHKRAVGAQAAYILPLLLCNEVGARVYDVHDEASLEEFEELAPAVIGEMCRVFFGPIMDAVTEAKKKRNGAS